MKFKICMVLSLFGMVPVLAQNTLDIAVRDSINNEPLIGVTAVLPALDIGAISDEMGKIHMEDIPNGTFQLQLSYVGYAKLERSLRFPLAPSQQNQIIYLVPQAEEMEEITLVSTRSTRTIDDIPTRVEVIAGEELSEKGNMKPGDIRMLLNESTGIQTQQTSATSYNSSIRIQGLDGKYTQLLRDGLPLYSGFSGGLSLMQIAPLDLKQVEVIKGASSTLYGGGAIAGLVNLITKTPENEPELSVMLNGTSALGLDASAFYSEKYGRLGTTVFTSYNKGTAYDPADNELTAIPKFNRFTVNPKLFGYFGNTTFNLGVNMVTEERLGGNINYIDGDRDSGLYFERNETDRLYTQFQLEHEFSDQTVLTLKNSLSLYDRSIEIPGYSFAGTQYSTFSEANLSLISDKTEWIGGLNLWTDQFDQSRGANGSPIDFTNATVGAFLQITTPLSETWTVESGLRLDYQNNYGTFPLPRLSLMYEPSSQLTLRLGGGLGYMIPTVFSEDAERQQFQNIRPIDTDELDAERSAGGNLDVNYRVLLTDKLTFSTNILLFYTRINDPLVLSSAGLGFEFNQPDGFVDTEGVEVNMKWSYGDLKLFIGYTHANVEQHYDGDVTEVPLVAKHRLNNVLMYEKHGNFWVGLEAYYFSPQKLGDGRTGDSYWITGLMTEKRLNEHFSLFLNFENFLDTRQTAFDTIYTGSLENPDFRDIYAPVDGFVINGGVKINL